jgi:hypothetical protein
MRRRSTGRRIGSMTSLGGLAKIILDIADAADLQSPPLSAGMCDDIVARIALVTGDGNPSTTEAAAPSPPICRKR